MPALSWLMNLGFAGGDRRPRVRIRGRLVQTVTIRGRI